jgi:glucosamine-6-phosphate deaminase
MVIKCLENYEAISSHAADIVAAAIIEKPTGVFGFATGSTPVGLYKSLIARFQRGEITFSGLTTMNLDEYVDLSADHEQSYQFFMRRHLFGHVDVRPEYSFFPPVNGESTAFDDLIQSKGGIDLQILGLGSNGHIGFNEPGSAFDSRTRVVELDASTIRDNARFFEHSRDVPRQAVTMGIRTILEARQILLLASGTNKADAVARSLEGPQTEDVPGSCLQSHPNVIVLLDEAAATGLTQKYRL